jgi:chromosome segregation ATPase
MAISDETLKKWEAKLKGLEASLKTTKSHPYNLKQEIDQLKRTIKNAKSERERLKPQLEGRMKIDEKIDQYLTEAREDFYEDRKNIAKRFREMADKIDDIWLPDPDSDYYQDQRGVAKEGLDMLKDKTDDAELMVDKAIYAIERRRTLMKRK